MFAALFVIAVGVASYSEIRNTFEVENLTSRDISMVPTDCSEARGTSGSDYVTLNHTALGALTNEQLQFFEHLLELLGKEEDGARLKDGLCWYEMPKFRSQYPEYESLSDDQLSNRLYEKAGIHIKIATHQSGRRMLMERAGIALGVPVSVFILGWSLLWAFSGFRREQTDGQR